MPLLSLFDMYWIDNEEINSKYRKRVNGRAFAASAGIALFLGRYFKLERDNERNPDADGLSY